MRVPPERLRRWIEVLDLVEGYARLLRRRLGPVAVVLHGSYARGDFNLWSDVDVIVVSPAYRGVRPLDRYEATPTPPPGFELIPWTPEEARLQLARPAWRQALARGHAIVVDDVGLADAIAEAGLRPAWLRELRARIARPPGPRG